MELVQVHCLEYRGTGLSETLLRFAEKRALEEGYKNMWVEHGTANPNARGFWNWDYMLKY